MQIREQARRIQCIRAVYDPALKRCPQKMIMSFPKGGEPTDEDLALLTPEEQQQLDKWLNERTEARKQNNLRIDVQYIHYSLDRATAGISAGTAPETPDLIWLAMDKLAKALKKAGYPKPRKTTSTKQPTQNEQPDFFDVQNYI